MWFSCVNTLLFRGKFGKIFMLVLRYFTYLFFELTINLENSKVWNQQIKVKKKKVVISKKEILMIAESHDNQMNNSWISANGLASND